MNKKIADLLIVLSVVATAVSAYVSTTQNDFMNLAGTQWMLVAIVLGIYGLYAKQKFA